MSPQNVVLRLGSLELSCWPSGHKPAQPSPAQLSPAGPASPAQPSPAQPAQTPVCPPPDCSRRGGSFSVYGNTSGWLEILSASDTCGVQRAGHILLVTTLSLVTTHHIHTEILLMTITYLQSAESAYLLRTPLIKTIDKAHDRHASNIA